MYPGIMLGWFFIFTLLLLPPPGIQLDPAVCTHNFSAPVTQEIALAIGTTCLTSHGVVFTPEHDLVVVFEHQLGDEDVWLVGYWARNNLPEYSGLMLYTRNTPIPPSARGPPFVPGSERNVYISRSDGRVLWVAFSH